MELDNASLYVYPKRMPGKVWFSPKLTDTERIQLVSQIDSINHLSRCEIMAWAYDGPDGQKEPVYVKEITWNAQ